MLWILYQLEMLLVVNKLVYQQCDQIEVFFPSYIKKLREVVAINVKDQGFLIFPF